MLLTRRKLGISILLLLLPGGVAVFYFSRSNFCGSPTVAELPVEVFRIHPVRRGIWAVPPSAIIRKSGNGSPFLVRLSNLQSEIISVRPVKKIDHRLFVSSRDLRTGDIVVRQPSVQRSGVSLTPVSGLPDGDLIRLIIRAGIAAVAREDLPEVSRHLSPEYLDGLGFDRDKVLGLIRRSFREFERPEISLAKQPEIRMYAGRADVSLAVRLTAEYRGVRNYLLGNSSSPNHIRMRFVKSPAGWKVIRVSGVRALGFEEKFLRQLGTRFGLDLTERERKTRRQSCLRCRQEMRDRFTAP